MYLSWRFLPKSIFPVFIFGVGSSQNNAIFMYTYFYAIFNLALMGIRQKKRQIKNHAKLTSYTVSDQVYTPGWVKMG